MNYGVTISSPRGGSVGYGQTILVTGTYGNFLSWGGTVRTLHIDVDFGPGGSLVSFNVANVRDGTFQASGKPGLNVRGTQSFNITATISGTFDQPGDAVFGAPLDTMSDVVTLTIVDALPPSITVNGFTGNQAVATASPPNPLAYTLSGGTTDPDSNLSFVRVALNNGPFQPANNVSGNWSQWSKPFSLPVGLHCFTIQAQDAIGHLTQEVRFLAVNPPAQSPPPPFSGSITSWTRLEPHVSGADIGLSSSARLFDPLWMLTRQWQVGEFQGEDAGSPVRARVRATTALLTRCHLGELPNPPTVSAPRYDPLAMPLEVMVERRPSRASNATDARMLSLSVEAALHFLRMLEDKSLSAYRSAFLTKFALQAPGNSVLADADEPTRRFMQSMVGRAPDARLLLASFRSGGGTTATIDPALQISATDVAKVQQVASAWLTWYDTLLSEPGATATDPWIPSRLEYAVSVATRLSAAPTDEVTLSASEFDDGRFDWTSFDLNPTAKLGAVSDTNFVSIAETTIPSPVTFRGAPAPRFWEMEEARVAYGLMSAGPTDLAQLMMIEYANAYGNDWYVVPLTIPVGSLTRVDSLVVTDTFGAQSLLRPMGDPQLPKPHWSMWQPGLAVGQGLTTGDTHASNLFFLPPSLGHVIDSAAVEDVLFMRDEMANLAWAIERRVENPLGQAAPQANDRASSVAALRPVGGLATSRSSGLPRYLLASTVPDNWIPLLPVQVPQATGPTLSRLRRGAVLQPDGSGIVHSAKSQLLATASLLYDEEVPREGVHITRARRMSRWVDGSTWVWTAFQREIGRGEGSSGLRFDQLLESESATP